MKSYQSKWFDKRLEAYEIYLVEGRCPAYDENISIYYEPRPKIEGFKKLYISFDEPTVRDALGKTEYQIVDVELLLSLTGKFIELATHYAIGFGTLNVLDRSLKTKIRNLLFAPKKKNSGKTYSSLAEVEKVFQCATRLSAAIGEEACSRRFGLDLKYFDEVYAFKDRDLILYGRMETSFTYSGNYGLEDWYFSDNIVVELDIEASIYDDLLVAIEKAIVEIGRGFKRIKAGTSYQSVYPKAGS